MSSSSLLNENSRSCKRFEISLRIFSFLFFFFSVQFLASPLSDTISINQGTIIFSADESFNKSIALKKIVFDKGSIVTEDISTEKKILIISKKDLSKNNNSLTKQIKETEVKKQSEILKIKQSHIVKHEIISYNFKNISSSSSYFSKSRKENQNFINNNGNNHHDYSTVYHFFINTKALDFLHSQKIYLYNDESLSLFYYEAFSARPPPIKINS